MASGTRVPDELRERLADEMGGWDEELERAAAAILDARGGEAFYEAERAVHALMRMRADRLVARVLEHKATAAEYVEPAREEAMRQAKEAGIIVQSNGRRRTRVQLLGGTVVKLRTLRLAVVPPKRPGRKRGVGRRGKAGSGVYPALAVLGITGLATPALAAEVAREVAESSSVESARASLRERGLDIKHETALRLTYLLADRALEGRRADLDRMARDGPRDDGEFAGKRVVVSVDGGRLRVRHNPKAGRRNKKTRHRRYKAPWKEPKVMTIYVINDQGDKDARYRTVLDGTMDDADGVLALMVGHLRLLGAHRAQELTLIGDGAEWIWARAQRLREAVGVPQARFHEVVDYYHAAEHLHEIANIPKAWGTDERKKWMERAKRLLRAGRIDDLIAHIRTLRVGRRSRAIADRIGYFENHAQRMQYATFRDHGLPIGSGAVESAVRRVVNLRLKGNSIFWLPEHAEGMLHLRSQLKAGRWDDLVRATVSQAVWNPRAAA